MDIKNIFDAKNSLMDIIKLFLDIQFIIFISISPLLIFKIQ